MKGIWYAVIPNLVKGFECISVQLIQTLLSILTASQYAQNRIKDMVTLFIKDCGSTGMRLKSIGS